uniref:Uncharacterized protein n=1 Tax=Sus scrofa TaxID=9823 RepID=A0A8D0NTL9_PIG
SELLLLFCLFFCWGPIGAIDKYVFITGCDLGFGNLLARQLDLRGLKVLAACLTEQGAQQLRKQTSDRLETVLLDVTKTESVVAATQWEKEHVGDRGLWGLVNNAGITLPAAPNEWLTKDGFLKILNVNLIGLIKVTLSFLPLIRKARGRVVNVSKAFSDSLRRDLCAFGVHVALIEPGKFKTSIFPENTQDILKGIWSQVSPEVKESYGEQYFEDKKNKKQKTKNNNIWVNLNLSLITNCMEHALIAVHPRTRYSAGWESKFFTLTLSYLPTSVADFILSPISNAVRPADALQF